MNVYRRGNEWVAQIEVCADEARFIAEHLPGNDTSKAEWEQLTDLLDARNGATS